MSADIWTTVTRGDDGVYRVAVVSDVSGEDREYDVAFARSLPAAEALSGSMLRGFANDGIRR